MRRKCQSNEIICRGEDKFNTFVVSSKRCFLSYLTWLLVFVSFFRRPSRLPRLCPSWRFLRFELAASFYASSMLKRVLNQVSALECLNTKLHCPLFGGLIFIFTRVLQLCDSTIKTKLVNHRREENRFNSRISSPGPFGFDNCKVFQMKY